MGEAGPDGYRMGGSVVVVVGRAARTVVVVVSTGAGAATAVVVVVSSGSGASSSSVSTSSPPPSVTCESVDSDGSWTATASVDKTNRTPHATRMVRRTADLSV